MSKEKILHFDPSSCAVLVFLPADAVVLTHPLSAVVQSPDGLTEVYAIVEGVGEGRTFSYGSNRRLEKVHSDDGYLS